MVVYIYVQKRQSNIQTKRLRQKEKKHLKTSDPDINLTLNPSAVSLLPIDHKHRQNMSDNVYSHNSPKLALKV